MKIGKTLFGICFAMTFGAFAVNLSTFVYYYETSPRKPQPKVGEIYKLDNHGDIFYVTKTESELVWYAFYCGMFGSLLTGAIYMRFGPKRIGLGRTRWR